jgi:iron complex transport system substrate-binding protein
MKIAVLAAAWRRGRLAGDFGQQGLGDEHRESQRRERAFSHCVARAVAFAATAAALFATALPAVPPAVAQARREDDAPRRPDPAAPARRIVALSPHLTELAFAAGAGARLVGAVEYSDYPTAARALPRVGDSARLDLERIAALKPDLLLAWPHGAAERSLAALERLGIPVHLSDPRRLDDIPATLEAIGALAGTVAAARAAADDFRARLAALPRPPGDARPVRTLLLVWDAPPMTLNARHLASDALRACGGANVFGALGSLAPTVTIEAVLAADPELIVALPPGADAAWLDAWRRWPRMAAVRDGALVAIESELLTRPTPRVLDGMRRLCAAVAAVRTR